MSRTRQGWSAMTRTLVTVRLNGIIRWSPVSGQFSMPARRSRMSSPNAPGQCSAGLSTLISCHPYRSDDPDNPCDRNSTFPRCDSKPYRDLADAELEQRIVSVKQQMGDSLLILGHHYQQDEVIRFADLRGDSFKLSQLAAASQTCRAIVFCGVHFMAETADILARDEVEVYLPDLAAGCSMADMADLESVEAAWQDLGDVIDTDDIMPVTYINSSAELKAFCGRHGGIVCTSSNARAVLDWSFAQRSRVLFFPDQHLGRNTARAMGIPLDQMAVWDPREPLGGNAEADRRQPGLALERPLLGPSDVQARPCRAIPRTVPRQQDPGPSRMHDAGRRRRRPRRLDRVHHQDHRASPRRLDLGRRHRASPGQSAGAAKTPTRRSTSFRHGLHVRDHVPDRSAPPGLVPREPGTRNAGQPDQGRPRDGSLGTDRTRADARGD